MSIRRIALGHADTPEDRNSMSHFEGYVGSRGGKVGTFDQDLSYANWEHGVDFKDVIKGLKAKARGRKVRVLVEACGTGKLPDELEQKGVEVVRSDLFHDSKSPDFHKVSVHDLLTHFGPNSFDLIISSRGGAGWSGNPRRAFANLHQVLKPGRTAYLTIMRDAQMASDAMKQMGIRSEYDSGEGRIGRIKIHK